MFHRRHTHWPTDRCASSQQARQVLRAVNHSTYRPTAFSSIQLSKLVHVTFIQKLRVDVKTNITEEAAMAMAWRHQPSSAGDACESWRRDAGQHHVRRTLSELRWLCKQRRSSTNKPSANRANRPCRLRQHKMQMLQKRRVIRRRLKGFVDKHCLPRSNCTNRCPVITNIDSD